MARLTEGPLPLYYQLADDIRSKIHSGQLTPGEALPSEERLCEEYGVSRITVRRAIDDLIGEELVNRRRGVGTFVSDPTSGRSVSLVGSLYDALNYPKNIFISLLNHATCKPDKRIRQLLNLNSGDKTKHIHVLSYVKNTPFAATHFYLPTDIGDKLELEKIGSGYTVARLVEECIGEPVSRAEQIVEPVSVDQEMGDLLGIEKDTAILHVLRTYYSRSNIPVEVASVFYRPDQYRLSVELVAPS